MGLDGDDGVDCAGKAMLPGLFDCHIHVTGRYEDDELTIQHRPFSYAFFLIPEILRQTIALGITTIRDAGGADLGLKKAVDDGVLVRSADADLDHDGQPNRRTQRRVAPERRPLRRVDPLPRVPRRGVRRRRGRAAEGPRGDPGRRRRDQDRVERRVLLAERRSASPALRTGRVGRDRSDRRRPRPVGDVACARARGHQTGGAGRRPLDRARHVPRPGVRRDDGRARHVAGAHARPPATRPRSSRTIRSSRPRSARSSSGSAARSSTR